MESAKENISRVYKISKRTASLENPICETIILNILKKTKTMEKYQT